jgi:RNA polymerase sigma-70 factor (ECF subfamily)
MDLMKNYETRLAKLAGEGDRDAFREIVEDNKKKIFYLAFDLTGSQQDAEDLSQDVFLKAFRSIHTFKGDASLSTWLYRITLNAYLDRKRKKSYEAEKDFQPLDEQQPAEHAFQKNPGNETPETYAESIQIQTHIENAMQHLTPRERSVFVMRHYEGLAGKEVGKLLNISEGTVKSLLSRAMKKLQNGLGFYRNSPAMEAYQ